MKPAWEKYVIFGDKHIKISVEIGLAGFELVLHAEDARVVVATSHGTFNAKKLQATIGEGIVALAKANKSDA